MNSDSLHAHVAKHLALIKSDHRHDLTRFLKAISDEFYGQEQRSAANSAHEASEKTTGHQPRRDTRNSALSAENDLTQLRNEMCAVTGVAQSELNADVQALLTLFRNEMQQRIAAEKQILNSEQKYRNIIEGLDIGIIETDPEGIVTRVYPRFSELTGYRADEIIGKHPSETFFIGASSIDIKQIEGDRLTGKSGTWEAKIKHKNGSVRTVMVSGAPLKSVTGDVVGSVGLHFDITDHIELQEQLKTAQKNAEEALNARERFLANTSHELRTPLNAIIGMSTLLQHAQLNQHERLYLDAITSNAEDLLAIISDLLNLSQINAGKFTLTYELFNLNELLQKSALTMSVSATQSGINLEYQVQKGLNNVIGDALRVNQIITNLVGNAIKFTPSGGRVLLEAFASNGGVTFQITDTGVGISSDKHDRIFESFNQEDDAINRQYGGTGLGLAIVKQLTELFGGSVSMESEKGEGTRFTVWLPLSPADQPMVHQEPMLHDVSGITALIVEDNLMNRMVLKAILDRWKVHYIEVENGEAAIETVRNQAVDLVLMDLQMPVLSGLETTQRIRNELHSPVPIIALTANALEGEKKRCLEAGFDHFLSKPFKESTLNGVIKSVISAQLGSENYPDYTALHQLLKQQPEDEIGAFTEQLKSNIVSHSQRFIEAIQCAQVQDAALSAHTLRPLFNFAGMPKMVRALEIFEYSVDQRRNCLLSHCTDAVVTQLRKHIERFGLPAN